MTPDKIKGKIISAIGQYMGKYQFPGGIVLPSIWVGAPPIDAQVNGLEILITEAPEMSEVGNKILSETWRIVLTEHTLDSMNTQLIFNHLRLEFRGRLTFQQRPRATEIKDIRVLPQITILWTIKELVT